ncbi:hypothetical protein MPNT_90019 [Candidatus Methylacidithermus pantelleriae]|uniref:Uncharacterized protein n=1 Tax=Candidatus Methylacidithermus pantelleriae TaxID=2744239 RepID=A0A8J2BSZ6_9BACT|nr:hypothetical protein MPNT_90019 [Candidatus Methylacidithermus pantelleriae]
MQKRPLVILRTELDVLLPRQKSRAGAPLFGLPRPLPIKSFLEEKRILQPCGREEGFQVGAQEPVSMCWGQNTRRPSSSLARPRYPWTAADRLRLRLPDGWKTQSQYLVLEGVRLPYREEAILQVLSARRMVKRTTKTRKLVWKREGSAVKLPL